MSVSTLNGGIKIAISASTTLAAASRAAGGGKLQDALDSLIINESQSFTFGTGALQANKVWYDTRSLSASASEELNVSGGSAPGAIALIDPYGNAVTFTRVVALVIKNTSATAATTLTFGGVATYGISGIFANTTDVLIVRPGTTLALDAIDATAYVVGANAVIKVTNNDSANSATYNIAIMGS